MVVAQEARAARIGMEILRQGGNAVDAAVATGFALAVTYPRAGNIGGGGYMLIHLAGRNIDTAIDYRETAPAATTRDIFLDEQAARPTRASRATPRSRSACPARSPGSALAHAKYGSGKFTLAELIAPAIPLARDGIPIEDDTADSLPRAQARLARWPSTAKIFLKPDGQRARPRRDPGAARPRRHACRYRPRPDRRRSTRARSPDKIVAAVRAGGGLMTRDDLKDYRPIERAPIRGPLSRLRRRVDAAVLVRRRDPDRDAQHPRRLSQTLRSDDARRLHLMVEAMKLAYADRAAFLGDPASVEAPLARLISKSYAAELRARIDPRTRAAGAEIRSGGATLREGDNTTHFSVVDRFGNAVSNTTTLNFSYGVGLVAEGTGVLLNNELDDFAAKPGVPNAFGLVGGDGQRARDRASGRCRR